MRLLCFTYLQAKWNLLQPAVGRGLGGGADGGLACERDTRMYDLTRVLLYSPAVGLPNKWSNPDLGLTWYVYPRWPGHGRSHLRQVPTQSMPCPAPVFLQCWTPLLTGVATSPLIAPPGCTSLSTWHTSVLSSKEGRVPW